MSIFLNKFLIKNFIIGCPFIALYLFIFNYAHFIIFIIICVITYVSARPLILLGLFLRQIKKALFYRILYRHKCVDKILILRFFCKKIKGQASAQPLIIISYYHTFSNSTSSYKNSFPVLSIISPNLTSCFIFSENSISSKS